MPPSSLPHSSDPGHLAAPLNYHPSLSHQLLSSGTKSSENCKELLLQTPLQTSALKSLDQPQLSSQSPL